MRTIITKVREQLRSGPNHIAMSTALRGTIAAAVPLAVLSATGLGELAHPAVLGAIATSLVDVGGPYRTRLLAMVAQAIGGSALIALGSATVGHAWLAAVFMGVIAIAFGLIRAVGPGGASLGTNSAVAFLVGIQIGTVALSGLAPLAVIKSWVTGYYVGGLWTVAVALLFWQLRPYRRLEQEVAAAWESAATLLVDAALPPLTSSAVARRRRDQRIAKDHAATRAALEQAHNAIGEMRSGIAGPGTTTKQLMILLDAAEGIAAVALAHSEYSSDPDTRRQTQLDLHELARVCRSLARVLLAGKGEVRSGKPGHEGPDSSNVPEGGRHGQSQAVDPVILMEARAHLEEANEALRVLLGQERHLPDRLRIPVSHRLPRGSIVEALRTHATPQSTIFRHAIRIAVVTASDTALLLYFRLPHGIWLPLTSLAVMQPEYGGTRTRALQRTLGTLGGAVIASALLATVHQKVGFDEAVTALLFATFLLIRRNYGYGITFLTPIVILLIGMSSANPWIDLGQRVGYTLLGTVLALIASLVLWPRWESGQLHERLRHAIDSNREFLCTALRSLDGTPASFTTLPALRRRAELAIANAETSFQRMLNEPAHNRRSITVSHGLIVHLQLLCRHTVALCAQSHGIALASQPLLRLQELVAEVLTDLGRVVGEQRRAVPWPTIEAQLTDLVAQANPAATTSPSTASATAPAILLARIMSDLSGLLRAAGYGRSEGSLQLQRQA
jgi:uncharacterized membrane protein YccC